MLGNNKTKGLFVVFVVAITLLITQFSERLFLPTPDAVSHSGNGVEQKAFQLAYFPKPADKKTVAIHKQSENEEALSNQCDRFIAHHKLTEDWAKRQRYQLQKLVQSEPVENAAYDYAFNQMGFTASKARALKTDFRKIKRKPKYHDEVLDEVSVEQQRLVRNFIRYGEVAPIEKAVDAGTFRFDVVFHNSRGAASLLEHIIVKADEPESLIKHMIELGARPTYTDLAAATVFGVSALTVSDMYYASGLNANKVLKSHGRYHSLLTHAVNAQSPQLIELWLEQGSPISPDPYSPNALDLLKRSEDVLSPAQLNALSVAMLSWGGKPNTELGKSWIRAQLNAEQVVMYQEQLSAGNELHVTSEQRLSAALLMQKIRALLLHDVVEFDVNAEIEHSCLSETTRFIAKHIENTALKRSGSNAIQEKKARKVLLARIAEAEGLYTQRSDIEAHLGEGDSIESKEIIEAYRRELVKRSNKERRQRISQANSDYDEIEDETKSIYETVLDLVKEKRWDESVHYLTSTGNEHMMPFLVNLFILYNAPNEHVFALLDSGVALASTIIYQLLRKDDVALAKALLPYGLDLNFTNQLGESALKLSVSYRAERMFAFMLSQGVDISTDSRTFDALDIALQQIDIKYSKDVFVKGLIQAGAVIHLSHKQWVTRKAVSDKATYDYLISQYPQLQ